MAAAVVGGAFLQVLFDRLASRQVLNFFKRQNLNDKLFKKLKMRMMTVNKVLNDAEAKQFTDSFVKEWLDELKDAVYEAEDFLDEVAYEALRLEVEAGSQTSTNPVLEFLSSYIPFEMETAEMEAKLEGILERLDDLIQQKDALGLREGIGEKLSATQKMPTTSLLDERAVYGREGDKKAITNLVLSEDENCKQLDVIPIVGMGGVGKTTLAQLIYNDSTVQQRFDLKAWVCVSEEFDVLKLTKDILKEISPTSSDSGGTTSLNHLHCELKDKTAGNKVLLVLDDVWSQNQELWDSLLIPFMSVKQGSKIIVTTRNDSVASVKSTVPTHHLQKLSEDDCWLVFARQAFKDGSSGTYPRLVEIGEKIVRKSNGLPLAAKALGGLLRSERRVEEWEKVLKSDVWNLRGDPVLQALRLSYYYLPSQLKQCFAFCAIFPKDYQFDKDELIGLWMAQGFIVAREGVEEMEEVGENYFDDLASRSFFQPYSCESGLFVMHDLINDLARSVSGDFCVTLEGENSTKITVKARHLSYDDVSQRIHEAELLRTFLPVPELWTFKLNIDDCKAMRELLPTLKRLRVLSLSHHSSVAELFDSMGKLKHLRYLNLEFTSIKELPELVPIAYNLQSLSLRGCRGLVELPDFIGNLKHLRYANLKNTAIQRLPASIGFLYNLQTLILQDCEKLVELPDTIGSLKSLRYMTLEGTKFKKLPESIGDLYNLQTLILGCCRELVELPDTIGSLKSLRYMTLEGTKIKRLPESMSDLYNLQTLILASCRELVELPDTICSLKSLGHLNLKGTKIKRLPESMSDLYNLQTLILEDCKELDELPDTIGSLKSLGHLNLNGTNIKRLPESMSDLYNLQTLILRCCRNLMELPSGMGRLINLCHLDIQFTYLSEMPPGMGKLTKLKKLTNFYIGKQSGSSIKELGKLQHLQGSLCIRNLQNVVHAEDAAEADLKGKKQLEGLELIWYGKDTDDSQQNVLEKLEPHSNLKELLIMGYGGTRFPDWMGLVQSTVGRSTSLEEIDVGHNLESLREHQGPFGNFTHLSNLSISCRNIVSFPQGGLPAPNLKILWLDNCRKLKWLPEHMHFLLPSLEKLKIEVCPEVELFPEGGLPSKFQKLHIRDCNKLIAGRTQWNLQLHPSLSKFTIIGNEEVESFPEDRLLPSTLTSLSIISLKNLKALSDGIQQLTSLRELRIDGCPELQSMPKERRQADATTKMHDVFSS